MFCATSFAWLIFPLFFRFCYFFSLFANENESSGCKYKYKNTLPEATPKYTGKWHVYTERAPQNVGAPPIGKTPTFPFGTHTSA